MSATVERKTLSIKGKPGMWSTPSVKEEIERTLKENIKNLLCNYNKDYSVSSCYKDGYACTDLFIKNMAAAIKASQVDLVNSLKFKDQATKILKEITENIHTYVKTEMMDEGGAHKFNKACELYYTTNNQSSRPVGCSMHK